MLPEANPLKDYVGVCLGAQHHALVAISRQGDKRRAIGLSQSVPGMKPEGGAVIVGGIFRGNAARSDNCAWPPTTTMDIGEMDHSLAHEVDYIRNELTVSFTPLYFTTQSKEYAPNLPKL